MAESFSGGAVTSNAHASLPRESQEQTGILRPFAACSGAHRDLDRVEHAVAELVAQRVCGLAAGREELCDHDDLRHNPLMVLFPVQGFRVGVRPSEFCVRYGARQLHWHSLALGVPAERRARPAWT